LDDVPRKGSLNPEVVDAAASGGVAWNVRPHRAEAAQPRQIAAYDARGARLLDTDELLRRKDPSTTTVYSHVLNRGGKRVRCAARVL